MKKIISIILVLAAVLSCLSLELTAARSIISDEGRLPFEDVKAGYWFADAAEFCYVNGIISGMNGYTYGFAGTLTRAQFVKILANIEGVGTYREHFNVFADVKYTHWYYDAVAWAYSEGYVFGVTDNTFAPNKAITRQELAALMYRYMKDKYAVKEEQGCLDKFSDIDKIAAWAEDAMEYMVSAGIISGITTDGVQRIAPREHTTRAQISVIMKSFVERYLHGGCDHYFTDATCTESQECSVCGMKTSLPNGHILTAYDCKIGGICTVCNTEVEPSDILHVFKAATCDNPRICTRCGTARGEANGHDWIGASCTQSKICRVCNSKNGYPLGHTTGNGICTRCNVEVFPSVKYRIMYYLRQKGEYEPAVGCYTSSIDHGNRISYVVFYPINNRLTIENVFIHDNGDMEMLVLDLMGGERVYDFDYVYVAENKVKFIGKGSLDAAIFTRATKEGFSSYDGVYDPIYTKGFDIAMEEMLADADIIINKTCGNSIKDVGFKVF